MRPRLFRQKRTSGAARIVLFAAAALGIIVLINIAVGIFDTHRETRQHEIAKEAIIKASIQCYSIELRYPPSLQYLADNYGIVLDEEKYIYHYRASAANLLPEVDVFERAPAYVFTPDEDGAAAEE